jgi:Fe-S-cluster containining protein
VEFSVYELQSMGGTVPDALVHEAGGNLCRMNGTERHPVRCVALADLGGGCIGCGIYAVRPRTCRDFPFASYGCHDTRAKLGLPALAEDEVEQWRDAA